MGQDVAERARDGVARALPDGCGAGALSGIVIADTKFELGFVDGELTVCDEVLTPDSSRFWPADQVTLGADAAVVRQAAGAGLPRVARDGTRPRRPRRCPTRSSTRPVLRYVEAYERITGLSFADWTGVVEPDAMTFDVLVEVTHSAGIADPQGATIERALPALGFDGIEGVHVGKAIRFSMRGGRPGAAEAEVEDLCQRFLTNPVIEDSTITVTEAA